MEDIPILRVNTLVDENDGSSEKGTGLSLRDAILIANSTSGDEIIELESNAVYELSIEPIERDFFFGPPDSASAGDLDIVGTGGTLIIRGLGEGATIDANQIDRVIQVHDSVRDDATNLILDNITLTGGRSIRGDIFNYDPDGGGLHIGNRATAELINSNITGNSAPNGQRGGGIFNAGGLTISNSNISNNFAGDGGGILTYEGNTTISDSIITNNSVSAISSDSGSDLGSGGGVQHLSVGKTEIISSNITNNTAGFYGGGVSIVDVLGSTGSIDIVDSVISGNSARRGGGVGTGGFAGVSITIENTTIENNVAQVGGGVGIASNLNQATITNSIIRHNESQGDGGGIDSEGELTVIGSTISNNTAAGNGGGIDSLSLKSAAIYNSTVDNNTADGNGGGLRDVGVIINTTISNNESTGFGGGMYTTSPGVIINSTFNGNETQISGGGIFVGNVQSPSVVAIANSTISGNAAKDNGGGIFINRGLTVGLVDVRSIPGEVFATNVTITENVADSDNDGTGEGGGIYNSRSLLDNRNFYRSGVLTLRNSILAENFDTPNNNGEGRIISNIFGAARGNGNNLTGNLTGLTFESSVASEEESLGQGSDITDVNPQLGELQDNGGSTFTHAPLAGSPAINAGNNDAIVQETFIDVNNDGRPTSFDFNGDGDSDDVIPYDQRGGEYRRIVDGRVDIGAFEVQENEICDNPENANSPDESGQTIDLFRFRNKSFDTGTYVFVGEAEKDAILADENLRNTFALDGVLENCTVNPAFIASTEDADGLIPFYRLESLAVPGTFLFVSTAEYDAIFAPDSNQKDQWKKQGFADEEETEDIAEFYLMDSSADEGIQFNRFQNLQNNTFLYAGEAETEAISDNPDLASVFLNQGNAFESFI